MATIKFSHSNRTKLILWLLPLVCLLGSCRGFNVPGNRGPVWLEEPVITNTVDDAGMPGDKVEIFAKDTSVVYCYLSIRGPEGFKLVNRWYHEDQLILEQWVDFGKERQAALDLRFSEDQPLPPGTYRCEFGLLAEKPLRSATFRIEE